MRFARTAVTRGHLRCTAVLLTAALALLAAGCGLLPGRRTPEPAWTQKGVAAELRGRFRNIRTLKAGDVSLQSSSRVQGITRETPTLGGVLALNPHLPGLWLRTEKLGQQIFTLGVLKNRFWMQIPQTRELVVGGGPAFRKLPYVLRPRELAALVGSPRQLGLQASSTVFRIHPRQYVFDVWRDENTLAREIFVNRRDLTVRRVLYYGAQERVLAEVKLSDYQMVDGIPLPHHLYLHRPQAGVRTHVWLDEPQINAVPPRQMRPFFTTPRKPGWRRINLNRQPLSDIKALQGRE